MTTSNAQALANLTDADRELARDLSAILDMINSVKWDDPDEKCLEIKEALAEGRIKFERL